MSAIRAALSTIEEICLPIKQDLAEVEKVIRARCVSNVSFVTDIAEYVVSNGGKRLRPALCLLTSGLAGASGQKVYDCAAAMEFFHTATLMHDDVIDNANIRRGKTSPNNKWGNHVAVLVGDFFYCQASTLLVNTDNMRIIKCVTDAMLATTEGEILEITKSNDLETLEEDYLKIITAKTAILMKASCEIGGLLGNVSEESVRAMAIYGENLGIAFQLSDDVLDYIAEEDRFGKAPGTDLKEGKLTLPLITALRHCSNDERRLIKDALITQSVDEQRLQDIIAIINRYEGLETTLKLAKAYVKRAQEALSLFKPCIEKEALLTLANFVLERKV